MREREVEIGNGTRKMGRGAKRRKRRKWEEGKGSREEKDCKLCSERKSY